MRRITKDKLQEKLNNLGTVTIFVIIDRGEGKEYYPITLVNSYKGNIYLMSNKVKIDAEFLSNCNYIEFQLIHNIIIKEEQNPKYYKFTFSQVREFIELLDNTTKQIKNSKLINNLNTIKRTFVKELNKHL